MRPRLMLALVGLAVGVLAVCDLEAALTARRWDPNDMGRAPGLLNYVLPLSKHLKGEEVLVTVRVETPYDVRVYRYRMDHGRLEPGETAQHDRDAAPSHSIPGDGPPTVGQPTLTSATP